MQRYLTFAVCLLNFMNILDWRTFISVNSEDIINPSTKQIILRNERYVNFHFILLILSNNVRNKPPIQWRMLTCVKSIDKYPQNCQMCTISVECFCIFSSNISHKCLTKRHTAIYFVEASWFIRQSSWNIMKRSLNGINLTARRYTGTNKSHNDLK